VEHFSLYVDEHVQRRTAGKRKVALYLGLAVLLAAATLQAVNAAGSSVRSTSARGASKPGGVVPQATGCAVTFTNPGPPALTACVSGHGNINQLSYGPFLGPVDHVVNEGYCLVDPNAPSTVYWDAGGNGEANWGVATQSSTATTTTVTRTTTGGIYTLTQNIFFKYGSRLVLIGNVLKNNDSAAHQVRFVRYADLDMEGTAGSDVVDTGGVSAMDHETNGVALTSLGDPDLVSNVGPESFTNWNGGGKSTCNDTVLLTPTAPGDWVVVAQHDAIIPAHGSVNFRVGYRLL
jgi:hypothetical protein